MSLAEPVVIVLSIFIIFTTALVGCCVNIVFFVFFISL